MVVVRTDHGTNSQAGSVKYSRNGLYTANFNSSVSPPTIPYPVIQMQFETINNWGAICGGGGLNKRYRANLRSPHSPVLFFKGKRMGSREENVAGGKTLYNAGVDTRPSVFSRESGMRSYLQVGGA